MRSAVFAVALLLAINAPDGVAAGFCDTSASDVNAPETVTWIGSLLSALGEAQECSAVVDDQAAFVATSACNIFVGRVLNRVYGVNDFTVSPASTSHPYYTANEIATLLNTWSGWTKLGTADTGAVREDARAKAGAGKIVIAVWRNSSGPGHVALIGPGPMTPSGSWGAPGTPVSSSFRLNQPLKAYLGKPLACAFNANVANQIEIWAHQ